MNRASRKSTDWLLNREHCKRQSLHNHNHMSEQASFKESMVLNLRRQRAIFSEKCEQIDELLLLIQQNREVSEFAELMQKLQTSPRQQPE